MRNIYLSGPMRGYPESNYPLFHKVAAELRAMGHNVHSPTETGIYVDGAFQIRPSFALYCQYICEEADTIVLLPGWEKSLGVSAELALAKNCGLTVLEWRDDRLASPRAVERVVVKLEWEQPDMRLVCEALGFDPQNHHNAARCPYCTPEQAKEKGEGTLNEGIKLAAAYVERLWDDHAKDFGEYDYSTNVTEFRNPHHEDTDSLLQDIMEGIRALVAASPIPAPEKEAGE